MWMEARALSSVQRLQGLYRFVGNMYTWHECISRKNSQNPYLRTFSFHSYTIDGLFFSFTFCMSRDYGADDVNILSSNFLWFPVWRMGFFRPIAYEFPQFHLENSSCTSKCVHIASCTSVSSSSWALNVEIALVLSLLYLIFDEGRSSIIVLDTSK